MKRALLPLLALALATPASLGVVSAAEAAAPRCAGLKATIVGTDRSERIVGTPRRDVIVARGGNDRIDGRGGADVVCGGHGNDRIVSGPGAGGLLYGEGGNDVLVAQARDIGLYGGPGRDTLRTAHSDTLLDGGSGDDVIEGGPYPDVIDGGGGNDRIDAGGGDDRYVTGGSGNDTIEGGAGRDVLRGGPGNDRVLPGRGTGDVGYGEAGNDTMATGGDGQSLYGGDGRDVLKTAWARTLLEGQGGDDQLHGGAHPDRINGGDGNDRILGGGGDDAELNGGFGNDVCDGGPGRDLCHGGAPGGLANTPTDPDVCTAEVMRSCRDDGLPQRWAGSIAGTTRQDRGNGAVDVATWNLRVVLVKQREFNGESVYALESATGGYDATGTGTCTFSASDHYDPAELSADLRVRSSGDRFSFEMSGPDLLEVTLVCPTSQRPHVVALHTGGRVIDVPRDPESGRLVGGSRLDLANGFYREWRFDLGPGSDDLP